MKGRDHRHSHGRAHWRRLAHRLGRDPHSHAALHAWLHEFEARKYYGLEEQGMWVRPGTLAARLLLFFVMATSAAVSLAMWLLPQQPGWFALAALVLLLFVHLALRRTLWPLWRLGFGVAAFGRGDLQQRIPVRRRDEIGALAARFNRMAEDIGAMLDAKRGLLLAISHELKSPITRARLHAELMEEGPTRNALVADLGLMRDLIDGLIERERLDAGHSALLLQAAHWPVWVAALVDRRFHAADLKIAIADDLPAQQLDRMRIELLLGNLLDNALRHNDDTRGPVELNVRREGQGVRLTVRDQGPGVADASLAQLGEPFYRPDESRSRGSGGVGLGLSLCKLIAKAHGAELLIENAHPGLRVSVIFPIT